jgi:hypothetical protein
MYTEMETIMTDFFLPISIALGLLIYGLAAGWYVVPRLRSLSLRQAVVPFLLFHGFRYIGLAFLLPGVTAAPLDPGFAVPAAYGDLASAVLALAAALAVRYGWPGRIVLAWAFSVVGIADLVNALYQGIRRTPDAHLGATYFIPAVIVPALLVTHVIVVMLLLRRRRAQ